ncbi:MAG: bifunctional proline dehydrogenase/L-glutamate gamma-semialdehyde dehydrogenase PutA, partial [Alphaproteobacteria bacterium]
RILGHSFVLGRTIKEALARGRGNEALGFLHSYDMLGEGARTRDDAARYHRSYVEAIEAIGASAGKGALPHRPGISVKLSALHPRFEATNRQNVLAELCPVLADLAQRARAFDLNLTVDAEEADRLELSLAVIAQVFANPDLAQWAGFGLAVQAYLKRAPAIISWADALAAKFDRKMMVRLVKGAYWDSEIKRSQERGSADYPVFTRKPATDISFLACARQLLDARPRLYPQFASHNALSIATIIEMAGDRTGFEFQCLHGMGEALFQQLLKSEKVAARIYAPVGGHRDLLAYLVRRLLENGANSSFVSAVGDKTIAITELLQPPAAMLQNGKKARHPAIPLPPALYGDERANSQGLEFGDAGALAGLVAGVEAACPVNITAASIIAGQTAGMQAVDIISPVDGVTVVGTVKAAAPGDGQDAIAAAARGFAAWSATPAPARAVCLDKLAGALEANRDRLVALLAMEAGKTLRDGVAEVREAVDFCRYYAAQARRFFGEAKALPGPTGEENTHSYRGRGVFVCISPWNFPLAIFLGQLTAALAAGNTVVAKPAPQTGLIAFEAMRLVHQAGVPADAAHLVLGDGAVGARLVEHPAISGVVFTGSSATARAINQALAQRQGPIVPLIAETGGLNAMIVDASALPEQVADDVVQSAFGSAGQRCSALRILFVQNVVAEPVLAMIKGATAELVLGDPRDPAVDLGPVIDAPAKNRLEAHIAAMSQTQQLIHAGIAPRQGNFVPPHIFELDGARVLREEVFGPILHIVRWRAKELDAVLDAIAATGYGLTLGIHSRLDARVARIAERLDVGNIYVNRNMIGAVVGTQPFGGSGLSGTGPKAGGPDYLRRFASEQVVSVNVAAAGGNASLIGLADGEE